MRKDLGEFKFTVESVGDISMVVVYDFGGTLPYTITMPLPSSGQTFEEAILSYAPRELIAQPKASPVPKVGTTGSMCLATGKAVTGDSFKAQKKDEIAAWRWKNENGVLKVGEVLVDISREGRAAFYSVAARTKAGTARDWKGADGVWHELNKNQMNSIADAIDSHVQALFTYEKDLLSRLESALDDNDVNAIILD